MNFGEWTEKRRETAAAVSPSVPKLSSFGEWTEQKRSTGGSFGSLRGTVSRTGGRGGGTVTTPASVMDYDSEMSRLGEQKRQETVDMDFDAVNAADNAMKLLRAQEGKQILGDRIGDVVCAATADTVGSLADTINTLWELAGGDADDRLADIAAEDSARFTRSVKVGLGKAGQFAVDTGISET